MPNQLRPICPRAQPIRFPSRCIVTMETQSVQIESAKPRAWRCFSSRSTRWIFPGGGCARTDGSCWSKSDRGRGPGAVLAKKGRARYCLAPMEACSPWGGQGSRGPACRPQSARDDPHPTGPRPLESWRFATLRPGPGRVRAGAGGRAERITHTCEYCTVQLPRRIASASRSRPGCTSSQRVHRWRFQTWHPCPGRAELFEG